MLVLNKLLLFACGIFSISASTSGAPGQERDSFASERYELADQMKEKSTEALKTINETAIACIEAGADRNVTNVCEEGSRLSFEALASCIQTITDALITAHNMANEDSETAIATVNKAVDNAANAIFEASATVEAVYGIALEKVGELARPGLAKAIELIQLGGVSYFGSLNDIKESTSLGINTGGAESDRSLVAADQTFYSALEEINEILIDSANAAFNGLKIAAGKPPVHEYPKAQVSAITIQIPEGQVAENNLTVKFNEALNLASGLSAVKALKTVYFNFRSSIFDNANAIEKAYKAIDDALQFLYVEERDNAATEFHNKMTDSSSDVLGASSDAILGLGAANEICGEKVTNGLKPSFISISIGRVNMSTVLTTAEKLGINALKSDILSAKRDLLEARAKVLKASQEFFDYYMDAADNAFTVLGSL